MPPKLTPACYGSFESFDPRENSMCRTKCQNTFSCSELVIQDLHRAFKEAGFLESK